MEKTMGESQPRVRRLSQERVARQDVTRSNCTSIDGDDLWNTLGRLGRYQVYQLLLLCIITMPVSVAVLSGVFVGKDVSPTCQLDNSSSDLLNNTGDGNITIEMSQCHMRILSNVTNDSFVIMKERPCVSFKYDSDVYVSFLSQWDLVCGNEALGQLPQMLTMAGMTVGAATLPHLGDRFGRKTLSACSHMLILAVNVGIAYAPVFELFLLLKFLSGSLNQGFMVPNFIMFMELFTTEQRTVIGVLANQLWVASVMLVALMGYILKDYSWRTLQLAYAATSSVCVLYIFLDESLRWLLANRKVDRAKAVLRRACSLNGKDYKKVVEAVLDTAGSEAREPLHPPPGEHRRRAHKVHKVDESPTLIDVMRNPALRKISLIVCYGWVVSALTYYGITLLSTSLAGDPYINFVIGAVLEFPANMVMLGTLKRLGRRVTVISFTFCAGLSLLSAVLVATLAEESHTTLMVQTALTLMGKFFISVSFNSFWIYTPELYPTNLRNVGIGLSSTCARIAATASPFFNILARRALWAPGALFSAACFLCVFLLTYLPETGWRELPQSIQEVESWLHSDKKENGVKVRSIQIQEKDNGSHIEKTNDII